jgi:hypothetical protein
MSEDLIKIAVLEQRVIDLKEVVLKVDDAIEKISQVNINITKMLAVHEEKLEIRAETDKSLLGKVDNLYVRMQEDHKNVLGEIQKINVLLRNVETNLGKRLTEVEKDQSKINLKLASFAAIIIFLGFIIQNAGFFSRVLSHPPLTNHESPARLDERLKR